MHRPKAASVRVLSDDVSSMVEGYLDGEVFVRFALLREDRRRTSGRRVG
jgi:hypothetical protein